MAGARPPRQRPRPSSSFELVGLVSKELAPLTSDVARRYGVSPATIRKRAYQGTLRALIDIRGRLRFPVEDLPRTLPPAYGTPQSHARDLAERAEKKKRRKKTRKKKRVQRKRKKKTGKKRRKKAAEKRPRPRPPSPPRPRPPRPPPEAPAAPGVPGAVRGEGVGAPDHGPPPEPPPRVPVGIFGPELPPTAERPPISAAHPMDIEDAARHTAKIMGDFIKARTKDDREHTYNSWWATKNAFKSTYGKEAWIAWFDWMVEEYELQDFIVDYDALRDS